MRCLLSHTAAIIFSSECNPTAQEIIAAPAADVSGRYLALTQLKLCVSKSWRPRLDGTCAPSPILSLAVSSFAADAIICNSRPPFLAQPNSGADRDCARWLLLP